MDIHIELAEKLMMRLSEAHMKLAGSDQLFFETTFNSVIAEWKEAGIDIVYCLNSPVYDWWYGNIAHGIIAFVAYPNFSYPEEKIVWLSRRQTREAIRLLHKILLEYKIELETPDYYGHTPKNLIMRIRAGLEPLTKKAPHVCQDDVALLYNVVFHTNKLNQVQTRAIRRFVRRKRAAKVICNYMQELVLSPYTFIGNKMLEKNMEKFQQLACSHV